MTLDQVMREYRNNCLTENLLSDAIILPSGDSIAASARARAAIYGLGRAKYYHDAARSLIAQMDRDLSEVSWRMGAYKIMFGAIAHLDGDGSNRDQLLGEPALHRLGAQYLSRSAEVLWTFYAVSLHQTWYLLTYALKWVSSEFTPVPEDGDFAQVIQAFRSHMVQEKRSRRSTGLIPARSKPPTSGAMPTSKVGRRCSRSWKPGSGGAVSEFATGTALPLELGRDVFAWRNAAYMARRRASDELPSAWHDDAQAEARQCCLA